MCKYTTYTKDELRKYLIDFYNTNNKSPTEKDFNENPRYPSHNTYANRFGSWNEALKAAGLEENIPKSIYADNELIRYLIDFYSTNNKIPTCRDFHKSPQYPDPTTYTYRFSSWNEALKAAGLKANKITYTDDELIQYLIDFFNESNRQPTQEDFDNNPQYPDSTTYHNRFGSWNNAIEKVGFIPVVYKYETEEERQAAIIESRRKSDKKRNNLGHVPINKVFDYCDGHHLIIRNMEDVLHIPFELHAMVAHKPSSEEKMFEINLHALNWYLHNQGNDIECKEVMKAFGLNINVKNIDDFNNIIKLFRPTEKSESRERLILLNNTIVTYTKDQLRGEIQAYYNTHEKVPEFKEFTSSKINRLIYIYKYGTWVNALSSLGFDTTEISTGNNRYRDEDLISYLMQFNKEFGRVPSVSDFGSKPQYPSCTVYIRRFGSWKNALIAAGFEVNGLWPTYTDDELIQYLIDFYNTNDKIPATKNFRGNPQYPNVITYQKRFGSWNNALIAAGLAMNYIRPTYTDDELIQYLIDFYNINNKIPTVKDFKKNPQYPSPTTYHNRFGSWSNALKIYHRTMR